MAYHVCPDCEGKGTKDNLGAMTSDYLDEQFGTGSEREEFLGDYKAGMYDVLCSYCEGQRVVTGERLTEWEDELQYRAEIAAERRMGA